MQPAADPRPTPFKGDPFKDDEDETYSDIEEDWSGMTYAEKVTWVRAEIRRIMNAKLQEITRNEDLRMKWSTYWRDIVNEHLVIVEGWPDDIPFRNVSHATGSLAKLELLCVKWLVGATRFRRVSFEEHDAMIKAGVFRRTGPMRKIRADNGLIRGRRRDPAKRSKKLRPYAIKSPLEVPEGADDM